MASRTSAMRSQEYYLGSKRGRPIAYDIAQEMFPDKYSSTKIEGDNPYQSINEDRRDTLKDYSPEQNSLFPYEQARRDTYSKSHINLRDGFFGSLTDPYASVNGDLPDTSFHDKDPRGYLTEIPWNEFRRLATINLQNTDFKSDADNSTTSGHIHPNTMYKNIRSAQDWAKARLKIFSEEYESRQNGGAGIYPNVSKTYNSDLEDTGAGTDNTGPSKSYDDDITPQHHNINISNIVHLGSKALRVNNTTDHLVPVAAYGKLYKQRGLMNHETQMRIVEDDTPLSAIEGSRQTPRNLVKMMASQIYSDNPNITPRTAQEMSRILQQYDQTEDPKNPGMKNSEMQNVNKSVMLTRDIMALFGFTDNEIKFLESYKQTNKKSAEHMLANIQELATTVHKMSPNEKLEIKNELILRSAGMGLNPNEDKRKNQEMVVVNPKIIEFMGMDTKKSAEHQDQSDNREYAFGDPENKLDHILSKTPLLIFKTKAKDQDQLKSTWESLETIVKQDTTKPTASYKHLSREKYKINKNQKESLATQFINTSRKTIEFTRQAISDHDPHQAIMSGQIDNEFGENKALTRHIGRIGSKHMRKHMAEDFQSNDRMNELSSNKNKNAKNFNNMAR